MAFCTNCGNEMDDNAKFCTNCGAPNPMMARKDPFSQAPEGSGAPDQAARQESCSSAGAGSYASAGPGGYASADSGSAGAYSYGSPAGPVESPSFMESVMTCFSKFATFSGRARRSEYWRFTLFNCIVSMALNIVGNMIFGTPSNGGTNILVSIYSLVTIVPGLAVAWRRLHDIGKSGLWELIALIPLIGWIPLLIWMCRDSTPGANEYGESPKYPYGA